jgi:uncharacterized protein YggE
MSSIRIAVAMLAASLLAPSLAGAQVPNGPYIAVQGHAEVKLVPDIFPVDISISDTSMNAGASQKLVEGLTREVMSAVAKLEVPDADIQLSSLHVSPQTKWDRDNEKQIFLGNEYERSIRVRLRKLVDVKALIAALPEGRNLELRVGGFERSDRGEIVRRLRGQAIADARAYARELTTAAEVKLGRIYNIADRPQLADYARRVNAIDVSSVESTTVNRSDLILKEGQITLSSDVYLIFELGAEVQAAR